jgi:hypothetical protein
VARRRSMALALLMVAPFAAARAQAPVVRDLRLSRPSHVVKEDFTRIAGVFELPGGRVLISDRSDERVVAVDLGKSTSSLVGRAGSGPAEYRIPGRLIRWNGDSVLLVDEGNARLAIIAPDLRIARSFVLNVPGVPASLAPRGVDPEGRMYVQVPRWAAGSLGEHGDSVPILRLDARGTRPEIVAWVLVMADPPGKIRYGLPYVPFTPQDVWAAGTRGELAIARSGDYHVEWRTPRGVVHGPTIPFQTAPVTEQDKFAHVKSFLEHSSIGGRGGANATPSGLSPLPGDMLTKASIDRLVKNNTFSPVHPPFTDEMPLLSPEGRFWVLRSSPDGAPPVWDVFDDGGNPVERVTLPAGRRGVALGRQAIYAIMEDDQGFERLERYDLPR